MTIPNLLKSQWWSYKKLEEFQNKRLKEMVSYAYNNIPGYRNKFNKIGLRPEDIKSKKDLRKIPVTTREELQNNGSFINKLAVTRTLHTGGSTGRPLKYYESAEATIIRWDAHIRGWSWSGYYPGKKIAIITSSQASLKFKDTLNLTGDLSTDNLDRNIKALIKFKPVHLRGYVSSLYILARYCLHNNMSPKGIESITVTSENLYSFQRQAMEKVFGCRVFEEYCCNDAGASAWECDKHSGLHYAMERAIIEDSGGRMLVTDLWNKAMPFIRYVNGDSVKFINKKCSCGRQLPLVRVKGRSNDMIITKKGVISPTFLIQHGIGVTADRNKPGFKCGIQAMQYIQKPGYLLKVNIVKHPSCTLREIERFRRSLSEFTRGLKIVIDFVDELRATKKGKRAFIINEDKELLRKWGI